MDNLAKLKEQFAWLKTLYRFQGMNEELIAEEILKVYPSMKKLAKLKRLINNLKRIQSVREKKEDALAEEIVKLFPDLRVDLIRSRKGMPKKTPHK